MKVRKLETIDASIEQAKAALKALYAEKRFAKVYLAEKQRQAEERKRQREMDKQRLVPLVEAPLYENITTLEVSSRAYERLIHHGVTRIGHLFLLPVETFRLCMKDKGRAPWLALEEHLIQTGIAARGGNKVKNAVAVPGEIVNEYKDFLKVCAEDRLQRERQYEEQLWKFRQMMAKTEAENLARRAEAEESRKRQRARDTESWKEYQARRERGLALRTVGDPDRIFIEVRLTPPGHPRGGGKYLLIPGFWVPPVDGARYMNVEERAAVLELDNIDEATATAEQLLATLN